MYNGKVKWHVKIFKPFFSYLVFDFLTNPVAYGIDLGVRQTWV